VIPIALTTSFVNAYLRLALDTLRGLGRHSTAFLLEFAAPPTAILIVAVIFEWATKTQNVTVLLLAHAGAQVAMLMLATACLAQITKNYRARPAIEKPKPWVFSNYNNYWFVLVANNLLPFAPYAILERTVSLTELGIFSVAHRLIGVTATVMAAVSQIYAPRLARGGNDLNTSQSNQNAAYTKAQLEGFVLAALFLIPYILFPGTVLGFFGGAYVNPISIKILLIFASCRLVQAAFGTPEVALLMTNFGQREIVSLALAITVGTAAGAFVYTDGQLFAITLGLSLAHLSRAFFSWLFLPAQFKSRKNASK
jgi:O-antigen/teichoic acid export membrane protein